MGDVVGTVDKVVDVVKVFKVIKVVFDSVVSGVVFDRKAIVEPPETSFLA